jgi:hypothetical protein
MLLSMNDALQPLELWLPDIKKYILEVIIQPLKSARYDFNKTDFSFKRTHGKNFEEFSFLFANQFPVNYRLGFLLQTWNHDIKIIKAAYPRQSNLDNYKLRSLVLFMSHFLSKPASEEPNFPVNDFVLVTNKDLFFAADSIILLLQEQALPLADQLSELDGLDSFFSDRPNWSVDSLNLNNMTTELTAAKLNGKTDYHQRFQKMIAATEQKILDQQMATESKAIMEDFYFYLKNRA